MTRTPCCEQTGLKRGKWSAEEDEKLINYIKENGEGSWISLPKNAGLLRCGKSCRLRWINYLRSDVKRGNFTQEEEEIIGELQRLVGNKWSLIASHLPGRTDNDIKNYWNSHLSRKIYQFRPKSSGRSTYPFTETFRRRFTSVSRDRAEKHNHNNNSNSDKQATQNEMALDPQGISQGNEERRNPNFLDSTISDLDGWSIPLAGSDNEMLIPRSEFDQLQLELCPRKDEADNINESDTLSPCPNKENHSFASLEAGLFACSSPPLVSCSNNEACWDFAGVADDKEVHLWSEEDMLFWNLKLNNLAPLSSTSGLVDMV